MRISQKSPCLIHRALVSIVSSASIVIGVFAATVSTAVSAATELQLWHAMEGVPAEALQQLTSRFNESQKVWQVVPVYQGDYQKTLAAGMAAARAGKAPHLLQVYEVGTADMMAERSFYKPLYQLAAETRVPVDKENYLPPAAAFFSDAAGRLLALPFNSSTPVMYYNRDAFIKAGLDPDKPPKTWYELQPALIKLQAAEIDCPYTTSWQAWVHLENVSAWHNHPFASANNGLGAGRAELTFNSHLMIRHISLMSAWMKSDLYRYTGRTNAGEVRFAAGECAVLTGSSAALSSIARVAPFKLGVAPLPHYDDFNAAPYNTLIGGGALWAMAGKTSAEYMGVARFMEFLASPAIAAEWHKSTGYIPVTRGAFTALQKSGYYDTHPEMQIAATQLRGVTPGSFARGIRLRHYEQIRAILDEELESVWEGKKPPKLALDDAVARGNALLNGPASMKPLPIKPSPVKPRCPGCK